MEPGVIVMPAIETGKELRLGNVLSLRKKMT